MSENCLLSYDISNIIINKECCKNCGNNNWFIENENYICNCNCEYNNETSNIMEMKEMTEMVNINNNIISYINNKLLSKQKAQIIDKTTSQMCSSTTFNTYNSSFTRLRKINNWYLSPHQEKSFKNICDKIIHFCNNGELNQNIINHAYKLFHDLKNNKEFKSCRGDNLDGVIGACIYYSCREHDISRTYKDISNICEVSVTDITNGINIFQDIFKHTSNIDFIQHITSYSDNIERYCNILNLSENITNDVKKIAKKVDDMKLLVHNTPESMICACIYYVMHINNMKITKSHISTKCNISIPTITKVYNRLLQYNDSLI